MPRASLALLALALEACLLLAHREIAVVNDFGNDVNAVLEVEIHQVRLAVLDLVNCGFFLCGTLNVGELIVVVDGGDQEGRFRCVAFVCVVELEYLRILLSIEVDLLLGVRLGPLRGLGELCLSSLGLLFIRLRF